MDISIHELARIAQLLLDRDGRSEQFATLRHLISDASEGAVSLESFEHEGKLTPNIGLLMGTDPAYYKITGTDELDRCIATIRRDVGLPKEVSIAAVMSRNY